MFFMLLLFVSFLLIGVSLIVIDFSSYDEKEITRLCDIDKTGRILLEWDEKNCQDFNLTEAAKLQNGHHYTSQYDGKGLIEETVMNRDMLNVMKLQWNRKKNAPTDGIILGWRYREKYKDKTKISCVDGDVPILGFTKKILFGYHTKLLVGICQS